MSLTMASELLIPRRALRPVDRNRSRAAPAQIFCARLLLRAVRLELVDIGPKVRDLAGVLDPAESHPGAWNHAGRVFDVFHERVFVPGDAGGLVGIRIVEAREGAGLAAVKRVERRSELDLGVRSHVVAGAALIERLLPRGGILRQRGPC